jgi:signal-transduction protein with cAMP-binding, CBS, and nucleotidyltransferase domain
MARLADILSHKGRALHTVTPATTVRDAIATMVLANVGSLLVREGDATTGIFTERDHLRRVTLRDLDPRTTRVCDVMTSRLIVAPASLTVAEAMALMTRERIRHLPVVEAGDIVGMVSIGDLVKRHADEQEVELDHLLRYVHGTTGTV